MKRKKVKVFYLIFWLLDNFFGILLVLVSFLQTCDISFFHIVSFYFFLQINFCIFLLRYVLTFLYRFPNNLLLYSVSDLFDNRFRHSFFIYNKKIYNTSLFSFRLELFIIFIASSLFICQK